MFPEGLLAPLSRFHMLLAFVAIIMLRVSVGYHFFKEGTAKLDSGNFTAEYFLKSAKGPLASFFHGLLDDGDGKLRLCVAQSNDNQSNVKYQLDPELTFAIWDDFVDRASSYYRFGDPEVEARLVQRRSMMGQQIRLARMGTVDNVDTLQLEAKRAADEADIHRLRQQPGAANEILNAHQDELRDWLDAHRDEVLTYYETQHRLLGFDADGQSRGQVAAQVASLQEQIDTIRGDRQKQLKSWTSEIETMWSSLESQINGLAVGNQANKPPLSLHRPFAQKYSKLQVINQIIPWFDVAVGVLLIVGLFTRLASLAGAAFLASVIASQPPWIPGTTPTYYQSVEMLALLVLFATCAGRMGGLDFFLSRKFRQRIFRSSPTLQPHHETTR